MGRKETAKKYIDILKEEADDIIALEKIIEKKKLKIKTCLLYLRQAKARNQVRKIDKYEYEIIE